MNNTEIQTRDWEREATAIEDHVAAALARLGSLTGDLLLPKAPKEVAGGLRDLLSRAAESAKNLRTSVRPGPPPEVKEDVDTDLAEKAKIARDNGREAAVETEVEP